jgi:hypothetical protein
LRIKVYFDTLEIVINYYIVRIMSPETGMPGVESAPSAPLDNQTVVGEMGVNNTTYIPVRESSDLSKPAETSTSPYQQEQSVNPEISPTQPNSGINASGVLEHQNPVASVPTNETNLPKETKELGPVAREYINDVQSYTRESWSGAFNSARSFGAREERVNILRENLRISKNNTYNQYEVSSSGYSPEELWQDAVEDQIASKIMQGFAVSGTTNSSHVVEAIAAARGVCDGDLLAENDFSSIMERTKGKLSSYFEGELKRTSKLGGAAFSGIRGSGEFSGTDAVMFLSEQLFGTEYTNGLKGKFREILGKDYQMYSRPEDLKHLKIQNSTDLLLHQNQ